MKYWLVFKIFLPIYFAVNLIVKDSITPQGRRYTTS